MFTGLIQDIGHVASVQKDGDWRVGIQTGMDLDAVAIGASMACCGCCLTVVEKVGDVFVVEVSLETLSKTGIGNWQEGTKVNLESSLRMGDELGGHFVFGHVDGRAKILSVTPVQDSHLIEIAPSEGLMRFIAPKGSVALDGVSLTVNEVAKDSFKVNIIAHTWAHTSFQWLKVGDLMNIEIDMLARYVGRLTEVEHQ